MRARATTVSMVCAAFLAACGGEVPEPVESEPGTASAPLLPPPDVEPGGGGGGGGGTPTTMVTITNDTTYGPAGIVPNVPQVPYSSNRPDDKCRQSGRVSATFQSPTTASSTLYFTGIVAPSTKATFHFYNANGQLVRSHETHHSHDNCVIQQETTTVGLPTGTYYVYASFWFIGTHLIGGWYMNPGNPPLAYTNRYVGAITVQ
ncbi:hypothetical protein ACLESO_27590 [Pyxidicoccus sp. 3LG]